MAEPFDPYLRWLGIRDPQKPPNHYRLLGVDLFEDDSDVIAVAADRQMAHVRTFQTGQFAALSQRLLNELSAARICLLKPEKKVAYDALLKKQLGAAAVATSDEAPSHASRKTVAKDSLDFASLASATNPNSRAVSPSGKKASSGRSAILGRKRNSLGPWIGLAASGILLVVGVIAVQRMGESVQVTSTDRANNRLPAATGTVTPSNSVQPKGNVDKKPVAGPETSTSNDGQQGPGVRDQGPGKRPLDAATLPPAKGSPPEPPVHSPRDVIRVDNPPQSIPANPGIVANPATQVAQGDAGKPDLSGGTKTDGRESVTHSAAKNPAPPRDQGSDSKSKRAPVPSKEQIVAAEAKVQKLFNVSAAKNSDERAALAKTLYEQGVDANNQEVDRYVLLRMAMKDAAALGDADLALQAAKKFAESFDVNAMDEKIGVLATLGKTVRTPHAFQAVLGTAQELLDSALAVDDFEAAKSLAQLAAALAAKSGDAASAREMRQRLPEIDQIRKEYGKTAPARDTLQTKPDDPQANYLWGYYLGPIKGDFDRGLPYLAKGNEQNSADMAKKELAQPSDSKAQAALADGWLELSTNEREPARSHLRTHAAEWYSLAARKLTGLEKKRVEDQLAKLGPFSRTLPRGGKYFIKLLTDGSWTITWLPNSSATDPSTRSGLVYKNMIFNPNGTCSNAYRTGTWSQDGPNSVVVHYPDDTNFLQRFALGSNGQLDCEYYNPPGVFQNHGLGTKDEPKSH